MLTDVQLQVKDSAACCHGDGGSAIFIAEVPRIVRAFLCHNGVANFPHSVTRATGVFSQQGVGPAAGHHMPSVLALRTVEYVDRRGETRDRGRAS
jgi:hypothetical protein